MGYEEELHAAEAGAEKNFDYMVELALDADRCLKLATSVAKDPSRSETDKAAYWALYEFKLNTYTQEFKNVEPSDLTGRFLAGVEHGKLPEGLETDERGQQQFLLNYINRAISVADKAVRIDTNGGNPDTDPKWYRQWLLLLIVDHQSYVLHIYDTDGTAAPGEVGLLHGPEDGVRELERRMLFDLLK